MARERLQLLSVPWKLQIKKCQAWKKSLQETWYQCFNAACKNINGYWSRSGQGPFQASPWSQFPYAGIGSGEVWVIMWGHGKQSSQARLEAKFVLLGLGCSLSWPQGHRSARAATLSKPRSSSPGMLCAKAQGPVCLAGTGLRFTDGRERCSLQGQVQDHPFPPHLNNLLGKVSTPQGNVLLCYYILLWYCPRKAINLRASNIDEERGGVFSPQV